MVAFLVFLLCVQQTDLPISRNTDLSTLQHPQHVYVMKTGNIMLGFGQ